jgi:uncharacterized protein (TIGR03435 family)
VTLKVPIMNAIVLPLIRFPVRWVGTERWDIEAKTEGVEGRLVPPQFNVLLRHLIEDGFQMKARLERKELPVCTLVVMKTGPMLKAHPANSARPCDSCGRGSATFNNMPVADLAKQLSLDLGRRY